MTPVSRARRQKSSVVGPGTPARGAAIRTALQRELQHELQAMVREWEIPGASLAVRMPDGQVLTAAAGWADREARTPMVPAHRLFTGGEGLPQPVVEHQDVRVVGPQVADGVPRDLLAARVVAGGELELGLAHFVRVELVVEDADPARGVGPGAHLAKLAPKLVGWHAGHALKHGDEG